MLIPLDRKWWFTLDADKGVPPGGDPSKDAGGDPPKDPPSKEAGGEPEFLKIPGGEKKGDEIDDGEGEGLASKKKQDSKADEGGRPSNIPEKFWNAEKKEIRVDTLAESYAEAESNLARIRAERQVPEGIEGYLDTFTFNDEGELKYAEGILNLPSTKKDDPLFKGALESFHKRGLSTEQAAGVIKDVFQIMDGIYPEPFDDDAYKAEQQAILGANHEMQVATAQAWIETLHSQGTLNLKEAQALYKDVGRSAAGIMAINKLRAEMTGEAVIPIHDPVPEDGIPTKEELYAMKFSPEYQKDAAFKKKVDELFPVVFPGTGVAELGGVGMAAVQANDARARKGS